MQDPGGGYGDALRKMIYGPFEKETGIKVVTVQEARSGPRIKAIAEAGKAAWDLTFIFDQETKFLADCCLATSTIPSCRNRLRRRSPPCPRS